MTDTPTVPTHASPTQVGAWVGLDDGNNDAAIVQVTATANHTITAIIGAATVPADIARHAALALASDLYEQRQAPNGIRMFTDEVGGAAPMRVRADSAARARAILAPFLLPTIV